MGYDTIWIWHGFASLCFRFLFALFDLLGFTIGWLVCDIDIPVAVFRFLLVLVAGGRMQNS